MHLSADQGKGLKPTAVLILKYDITQEYSFMFWGPFQLRYSSFVS